MLEYYQFASCSRKGNILQYNHNPAYVLVDCYVSQLVECLVAAFSLLLGI